MMLKVKFYRVYNFTIKELIMQDFHTREDAKDRIKQDDDERRMLSQKYGQPFEHHKYMISEAFGYAEGDVDDGYELSFDELCNACYELRSSNYCEVYQFDD